VRLGDPQLWLLAYICIQTAVAAQGLPDTLPVQWCIADGGNPPFYEVLGKAARVLPTEPLPWFDKSRWEGGGAAYRLPAAERLIKSGWFCHKTGADIKALLGTATVTESTTAPNIRGAHFDAIWEYTLANRCAGGLSVSRARRGISALFLVPVGTC
jgi:hypothetical protein